MASGRVKFFNATKGFGFIEPDSGGPDVFLHVTDLRKTGLVTIPDGAAVTFDTEPGKQGKPRAVAVKVR